MKMFLLAAFLMVVPSIYGENIFLDNLKPEEAQKFLASHDLSLKYAPKIDESPLPLSRSYNGETLYRGRKISNPNDYVEDTFLANQFHGQDGLGRALFGYTDWNQGRVEAINGNGHVRGSYKYVDPYGKDYVANYWSDGLGFHHEDNRPKVVLEPVTDTPAVQRARAEHFRKWNEAAAAAKASPDPHSDYYNRDANRYPNLSNQRPVIPDRDYNPDSSQDSVTIDRYSGKYNRKYDAEPTGPPHGFYYNFDYPVHLLRRVKGRLGGDQYEYGSDYGYDNSQYKNENQYSAQQYNAVPQGKFNADYNQHNQFAAGHQGQYNAGHQGHFNKQQGQFKSQYDNQGQFNQGQYNEGQYNEGQYNEGQYKGQYENQGQYNQHGQGQFRSQFDQYNHNQGQYQNQGQYSQFPSSQGIKKFDSFFNGQHKRTVEDQVATPALKADLTEARVDAVHDVQVHPKQRAAIEAQTAEGQ